jgi:lipoate-protein ligase B
VLRRRHLGRITFAEANDFQRALVASSDDYILLFEHPPTYTKGIRTQAEHFLVPPETLDAVVIDADRGGDVTYHAPGQVVAWAIVTVLDDPSAGKAHVKRLEDAVTATVRSFDPERRLGEVGRLEGYPGVWAHLEGTPSACAPSATNEVRVEACTALRSTSTSTSRGSHSSCRAESPTSRWRRCTRSDLM